MPVSSLVPHVIAQAIGMMGNDNPIDFEKALLNPAAVFRTPEEVLESGDLTREQKVEILRRWKFDAHAIEVAEEENMGSGQTSDLLSRILNGLHALDAAPDLEHSPPTKQGGV